MTFLARQERFARIGSTNDAVRAWLAAGTPEVCLAVADEQTAGRGRAGRTWVAPPGAALLLSVGFRPAWLAPAHAWRLAAVVSLAMADAAEELAGLRDRAIRLKWPNDLVMEEDAPGAAGTDLGGGTGPDAGRALAPGSGSAAGRSASSAASSARPTASGPATRGWRWESASTRAGRGPTSRPGSPP